MGFAKFRDATHEKQFVWSRYSMSIRCFKGRGGGGGGSDYEYKKSPKEAPIPSLITLPNLPENYFKDVRAKIF